MLAIALCTYLSMHQFILFSLAHVGCTLSYNVYLSQALGYDIMHYRLTSE